jgi:hypothetical protein
MFFPQEFVFRSSLLVVHRSHEHRIFDRRQERCWFLCGEMVDCEYSPNKFTSRILGSFKMKRAAAFTLSTILAFGAAIPVTAQRNVRNIRGIEGKAESRQGKEILPVSTSFGKAQALTDGSSRTLVKWQMTAEKGVLAYNVFRMDLDGEHLVTNIAITGSGAINGNEPVYGEQYSTLDSGGHASAAYLIEAIALDGGSSYSTAISTEFVYDLSVYSKDLRDIEQRDLIEPVKDQTLTLTKELTSAVERGQIIADPDTHKWVISQPGVKIGVKREGLHRVTRAQLESGGFDVNTDSTFWQLYDRGVEQSLIIGPNADYIEFYGRGIDTPESDTRAYFLIAGPSAGKRMSTRVSRPNTGTVVSQSYSQTFKLKERLSYFSQIRNGDEENFWGRVINFNQTTLNFSLSGVDYSRPNATVSIKFQGFSSGLHQVEMLLNDQLLNIPISAGQISFTSTQVIPTSMLVNGLNSLKMRAVGPSGDVSLFDSIQVSFDRKHLAEVGKAFFYTLNDRKARVEGFSTANIRLFDTTYENHPYEVTNLAVEQDGSGFALNVPAQKSATFYAVESSSIYAPVSVQAINPEILGVPNQAANVLIIAYKDFLTEAENWAIYRRSQGFSVKVVDVDQIFEEFSYGVLNADAIKAFLHYSHTNWQIAPQYVLLMGDASFDSRNYLNQGFYNLVPTRLIDTLFTETGSDEFLADFNNDGLAEISIGRIPARTGNAAQLVIDKISRWESNLAHLNRGVLFAYDRPNGYDFQAMSNRLRQQLPSGTPTTMVFRDEPDAQAVLLSAINTGKYFANYSGHGSVGVWAATSFFSTANVTCTGGQIHCVNNVNNETAFTMLTCLNGYFITTGNSLAEALLLTPNGGAVAAWASTGETTADVQEVMGIRFYQQLGAGNITRMGDLIKDAKTQIPGGRDVRLSWALLGDPMLKVR